MENGGKGALIGSIIVVLVLIAGAIYYWDQVKTDEVTAMPEEVSSEIESIEADLNAINLDDLDISIDEIETELSL